MFLPKQKPFYRFLLSIYVTSLYDLLEIVQNVVAQCNTLHCFALNSTRDRFCWPGWPQKSGTRGAAPRVPLFCSDHILTSSVIYYWTDAWQLGIYLLSIIQLKNNLPADFTLLTVERVLVNTHKMLTLWAEIFWQFYATAFAGLTFFVYLN